MINEKSTYEKFQEAQQQVVMTVLVIAILIYGVVAARNFFVTPRLVQTGLLQSEKQAFQNGVDAALNQ